MESPYIGKARYKANSSIKENIVLNEEQTIRFSNFLNRLNPDQLKDNDNLSKAIKLLASFIGKLLKMIIYWYSNLYCFHV